MGAERERRERDALFSMIAAQLGPGLAAKRVERAASIVPPGAKEGRVFGRYRAEPAWLVMTWTGETPRDLEPRVPTGGPFTRLIWATAGGSLGFHEKDWERRRHSDPSRSPIRPVANGGSSVTGQTPRSEELVAAATDLAARHGIELRLPLQEH